MFQYSKGFSISADTQRKIEYNSSYGWDKAGVITTDEKWHQYLNVYPTID